MYYQGISLKTCSKCELDALVECGHCGLVFHEAGVNVPQDIEIIGHDNYDLTRFTIPSLSTVHLPVEEMAGECVNILLHLIEHKVEAPVSTSFETSLVLRQSCIHDVKN